MAPVGFDFSVDAVVGGGGVGEVGVNGGGDLDSVEPWGEGFNAADVFEHPLHDGSIGVVGEGVHAGVLEAVFGGPAVPAFPDGGGSVDDGEEPAGEGLVVEEAEGDIVATDFGEDMEDVAGADEAGAEVPVAGFDVGDEVVFGLGGEVFGEEVETEGEDVSALGVATDFAVGVDIFLCEGGGDVVGEFCIGFGVVFVAKDFGGLGDDAGGAAEVGGVDDFVGGVGVDLEPVAEAVELIGREEAGFASVLGEVNEAFHVRIVLGEVSFVSVELVDRPRADDAGVGPGGASVVESDHDRGDLREVTVFFLRDGERSVPFFEEGLNIAVEGGGSDIGLGVAGPAHAFVALGAVGGDIDEVHFLRPPGVAGELVEHGVAGGEATGFGGGGGDGDGLDVFGFWFRSPAGDFYISEAVEGEAGLPDLGFAVADEGVDGAGSSEVRAVDRAVGVEDFDKAEADGLSGFAGDVEAGESSHVLAEI